MAREIQVNRMPSPTWNWLKMNVASAQSIDGAENAPLQVRLPDGMEKTSDSQMQQDIPTGMGEEMDAMIEASEIPVQSFLVKRDIKVSAPLYLDFSYSGKPALNAVSLTAEKGSEAVVIMDFRFAGSDVMAGAQIKYALEKDAKLTLVQIQRPGASDTFFNDVGGTLSENASVHIIQVLIGGKDTYVGVRNDLIGKGAFAQIDSAYLLQDAQRMDINYIANHIGKKTECRMTSSGVLRDFSAKTYRGTIDFKNGCAGAVGNETEDVLLMDDGVVNRTIPVILCAEEDVEGNHGATIGRLDEELLFYLESRGIDRENVYEMMAAARIEAVAAKLPDETTRKALLEELGTDTSED